LFPRWWIPLLIVPVFIALARIDENYHFLSDVLASIALACLITLIAAVLFKRWIEPGKFSRRS
jgi:membrane-associated phospholipid phosphatase